MKKKKKEDKLNHTLLLYHCLCEKIKTKKKRDKTINREELKMLLGIEFHIPKELKDKIIAELIEMNFLEYFKEGRIYYYKVIE